VFQITEKSLTKILRILRTLYSTPLLGIRNLRKGAGLRLDSTMDTDQTGVTGPDPTRQQSSPLLTVYIRCSDAADMIEYGFCH